MKRTYRAAGVAIVQGLLILLGTPGLDFSNRDALTTDTLRGQMRARVGNVGLAVGEVFAGINRHLRLPITDVLEPIQKPFHILQLWSLYRDGPNKYRRLQVYVNGQLVYRSLDPDLRWLEPQLRSRRIRPIVEEMCLDEKSKHARDLVRWMTEQARSSFADATEVRIECTAAPFPGDGEAVHHGFITTAPDWAPKPE